MKEYMLFNKDNEIEQILSVLKNRKKIAEENGNQPVMFETLDKVIKRIEKNNSLNEADFNFLIEVLLQYIPDEIKGY